MLRNSNLKRLRSKLAKSLPNLSENPRLVARLGLGFLLLANLAAAWMIVNPVGGSPEELEQRESVLRQQLQRAQANLGGLRSLAANVEKGRTEGDRFLDGYFLTRSSASSAIISELNGAAEQTGINPREHAFVFEPIEGSETLSMMTITGNYEGSYNNLIRFVNLLDRSPRLMIIEGLQAAPQQSAGTLQVSMKVNAFVQEGRRPQ